MALKALPGKRSCPFHSRFIGKASHVAKLEVPVGERINLPRRRPDAGNKTTAGTRMDHEPQTQGLTANAQETTLSLRPAVASEALLWGHELCLSEGLGWRPPPSFQGESVEGAGGGEGMERNTWVEEFKEKQTGPLTWIDSGAGGVSGEGGGGSPDVLAAKGAGSVEIYVTSPGYSKSATNFRKFLNPLQLQHLCRLWVTAGCHPNIRQRDKGDGPSFSQNSA